MQAARVMEPFVKTFLKGTRERVIGRRPKRKNVCWTWPLGLLSYRTLVPRGRLTSCKACSSVRGYGTYEANASWPR